MIDAAVLVLSFATLVAVVLIFTWGGTRAAVRFGGKGLVVLTASSALAATALFGLRLRLQQLALGFTEAHIAQVGSFTRFLPMFAAAFAAAALVVHRRLRRGKTTFTAGLAAKSFAAFVGGAVVSFLVFAVIDFTALF